MSVIIVSDTHGTSSWQSLFKGDDWKLNELVIFLGDYCDSYTKTNEEILQSLDFVLKLKDEYPDKVVLLMGNHDMQYYSTDRRFGCSGYRFSYSEVLERIFTINSSKFKLAKSFKINGQDYLCTHAGVLNHWLSTLGQQDSTAKEVETLINHKWESQSWDEVSMISGVRGGRDICGGPLWADMDEFRGNVPKNFNQIVGHTHRRFGVVEFNEETSAFVFCTDNLVKNEFDDLWITQILDNGKIVNANSPNSAIVLDGVTKINAKLSDQFAQF